MSDEDKQEIGHLRAELQSALNRYDQRAAANPKLAATIDYLHLRAKLEEAERRAGTACKLLDHVSGALGLMHTGSPWGEHKDNPLLLRAVALKRRAGEAEAPDGGRGVEAWRNCYAKLQRERDEWQRRAGELERKLTDKCDRCGTTDRSLDAHYTCSTCVANLRAALAQETSEGPACPTTGPEERAR